MSELLRFETREAFREWLSENCRRREGGVAGIWQNKGGGNTVRKRCFTGGTLLWLD